MCDTMEGTSPLVSLTCMSDLYRLSGITFVKSLHVIMIMTSQRTVLCVIR